MTASHSSVYEFIREFANHLVQRPGPRRVRVLVVDDDEPTRRYVDRVLRDAGFETATAGDGLEALAVAQEFTGIDLLLTDVVMPSMAGDELARRLRKMEPALKVLYLTGHSDVLFEDRPCLWEDEAYLDKPCRATALLQAVSLLQVGRLTTPGHVPAPESDDLLFPAA